MLHYLAILSPSFICLQWAFLLFTLFHRTRRQRFLAALVFACALYYFGDAYFMYSEPNYKILPIWNLIGQFTSLMIFPMVCLYVRLFSGKNSRPFATYLLFIPAIIIFVITVPLYSVIGIDEIGSLMQSANNGIPFESFTDPLARTYFFVCTLLYNSFILVEIIASVSYLLWAMYRQAFSWGNLFRFFFKKGEISPIRAMVWLIVTLMFITAVRIAFGRPFLMQNHILSGLLSLSIAVCFFGICYVAVFAPDGVLTLARLRNPLEYTLRKLNIDNSVDRLQVNPNETRVKVSAPSAPVKSAATVEPFDTNSLIENTKTVRKEDHGLSNERLEAFKEYLKNERPFLDPDLTIEKVAADLKTNRTYISTLINNYYKSSFRDVINALRIEEAKRLMIQNPEMILDNVAIQSGFLSASQLSKKFKEREGVTPRVWLQRGVWERKGMAGA